MPGQQCWLQGPQPGWVGVDCFMIQKTTVWTKLDQYIVEINFGIHALHTAQSYDVFTDASLSYDISVEKLHLKAEGTFLFPNTLSELAGKPYLKFMISMISECEG